MSNYRAGDVIRMTREYIGISREELSDGICSPQTLYRLECGKTRVKKELYAKLMAKMERVPGLCRQKYGAFGGAGIVRGCHAEI